MGRPSTLKEALKVCDQCEDQFFFAQDNCAGATIICADGDAYFCSTFCKSLWLAEQFQFREDEVYGDGKYLSETSARREK
jgi:hypothetical protein